MKYDIKGCERLANAIIKGACNEYCTAKKILKDDPNNAEAFRKVNKNLQFFHSEFFQDITDVKPAYLIEKLNEMCEE